MVNQCIVCSSSQIQSEDSERTITNIGFTDEEFWSVFSYLFQLDSSIIRPNCNDPLDLKFCSTCKPTAVKLFNLHHQLECIERQLSQTIAHVSSTIVHTEDNRTDNKSCNDSYSNSNNIRKAIYQRFTPRVFLENYQLKRKLVKRHSSQQKTEGSSTLNAIKTEPRSCTLKDNNDDDFHSKADFNYQVEEDRDKNDIGDDDHLMNYNNDSDSDFNPEEFSPPKKLHVDKRSKIKRVKKSKNTTPKASRRKGLSKRKLTSILVAQRRKLLESGDLGTLQSESEPPVQESESTNLTEDNSRFTELGPGEYLYLEKYEYTKEPDGYYKCGLCKEGRRKSRNDVHRHINNKHNKDRISCDKCNGHWDSQTKMDKHVCRPKILNRQRRIRKHGDDRYSYDNEYFFIKQKDLFICQTCNESQKSISNMSAHIVRRHAAPSRFVCEHCAAAFGSKKNFQTHIVQHSDLRPYLCDQCPATFKTPEHLWCHQKKHGAPQYECNVCTKKFKYSHGLRRHRLTAGHPAPPLPKSDSLFYCPKCNNSYLLQHTLDIHLKTCTGKKQFHCNECDKIFPKLSNLRGHQNWNHKRLKKKAEKQQEPANSTNIENQPSETLNVDLDEKQDNLFI